ncbi:MAG: glutaredoxin family protein [Cyanobacteriota bacterium]
MPPLILYTRRGCCLCEGLEERLREFLPPEALRLVDVDGDPALQARYGLSVPVLAQAAREFPEGGDAGIHPLPPVPPRLRGERLRAWLERQGCC